MNQPAFDFTASYPIAAGYKREGTSREAAESINVAALQAKVLKAYRLRGDMTPDECAEALNIDDGSIRPRCTELKNMGKLVDAGYRRPNKSGRSAAVLKAVLP